jgi:hypothetical protein
VSELSDPVFVLPQDLHGKKTMKYPFPEKFRKRFHIGVIHNGLLLKLDSVTRLQNPVGKINVFTSSEPVIKETQLF